MEISFNQAFKINGSLFHGHSSHFSRILTTMLTWQKVVKNKARQLGSVGRIRLPGWRPRDPSHLWLDTLKNMAANRSQWRECCFLVAESVARQR